MSSWLRHGRRLALLIGVSVVLAGCGSPNSIGNMPGPVRKIINTPTLSGHNIGANILQATGNAEYLGSGQIPGYYNYGPSYDNGSNTYYVTLEVPINVAGLEKSLHYLPHPIESTTIPEEVYINVPPLPNMAFDRLYFDPSTHLAPFSFKLLPNGQVLDVSWDAVLVNS